MAIEAIHLGLSSTLASERIMLSMHGFAWSFTMSLIHSLLHFAQSVYFFRSKRTARHSLSVGLGKICSLKYDLPWNGGSLHIQASQRCSPLSAVLGQNAHFHLIGGFYSRAHSRGSHSKNCFHFPSVRGYSPVAVVFFCDFRKVPCSSSRKAWRNC